MSPTNFFITGAHGLTLVHSKYYKGFLRNSVSCLLKNKKICLKILAMGNIPEVTPHKKRRKFILTFALSIKVIIQVWKSQRVLTKVVVRRCSVKRCSYKFRKIHRKAPVPVSLF